MNNRTVLRRIKANRKRKLKAIIKIADYILRFQKHDLPFLHDDHFSWELIVTACNDSHGQLTWVIHSTIAEMNDVDKCEFMINLEQSKNAVISLSLMDILWREKVLDSIAKIYDDSSLFYDVKLSKIEEIIEKNEDWLNPYLINVNIRDDRVANLVKHSLLSSETIADMKIQFKDDFILEPWVDEY